VLGAPVVCLIGGSYVTALFDGGRTASILVAGVLLLAVVGLTLGGARAGTVIQFGLVVVLIGLVVLATAGSAHAAHASNWTPFDPHGWRSVGSAASVLMLSFVGWEAIAGLTPRLADPRRQLPRMIAIAFAVTAAVNLGLAVSTISVLSPAADSSVPLAGLLRVAVGSLGPLIAAVAALALTLASTNAYITGAMALAADLRQERTGREAGRSVLLQLAILASGLVLLGAVGAGLVSTVRLVAVPTALFLTVYLGCTAAAARVLTGRVRIAAGIALLAVAGVLAFSGWALAVAGLVAACGFRGAPRGGPEPTPARLGSEDEVGVLPATSVGRGGQPQCLGVA
jgi:amino acid efflux transporter